MKVISTACLIATASAFAPSYKMVKSYSLQAFEKEVGAQVPLGMFDPLGLVSDGNEENFNRLRYVELKHGRIAMLAFLGQIVTRAGIHFPGDIDNHGTSFASIGNGFAALDKVPLAGIQQMICFIGILELLVMKDVEGTGEFPGDFRNGGDYGWSSFSDATKKAKRSIELNNGRAAQMGILGLMVHEQLHSSMPLVGQL
jgi:Chlorophyll A-B binding protein